MKYRILLVGGGSGGHIFPLKAVARELIETNRERGADLELMALAESDKWRSDFESIGVKFKKISFSKFRQVERGRINFLAFLNIPLALIQSLWAVFIFMPDLVFSKGGFASVIPSLASKLYFIPLFIHESDAVPGLANRFLAGFSNKIFISFEDSAGFFDKRNTVLSGNPVRKDLAAADKNQAAGHFNLRSDRKTILFLGGSQGAVPINDLVLAGLVPLAGEFQIIHQTGDKNLEKIKQEAEKIKIEGSESYGRGIEENYRVYGFLNEEDLKNAYALSDVIVARAGANLIFEISSVGKPAIIIPYKYSAGNHQKANAAEFARFGAVVLEEANLKPHILMDQIKHLMNPEVAAAVSQKIKEFVKPDAASIITQEISNYVFRQ